MTAIIAGLAAGSIYALIAIGYNITYLTAGALNFAQANLMVLGGFLSYWAYQQGWPTIAVCLFAGVSIAALSLLTERVAVRTLRNRSAHSELVTTLGVATIITGVILVVWGPDPRALPLPGSDDPFQVLGGRTQIVDIVLFVSVIAITIALMLVLKRTRIGIATLAQSEDTDAASLRGIDVRKLSMYGFAVSGLVVGLLSPVVGNKTFAAASLSLIFAIKGFVALTIGGVGSIEGALIGGLSIGVIEALSSRYIGADYREIAVFVVFAAILVTRPQGLFGTTDSRVV